MVLQELPVAAKRPGPKRFELRMERERFFSNLSEGRGLGRRVGGHAWRVVHAKRSCGLDLPARLQGFILALGAERDPLPLSIGGAEPPDPAGDAAWPRWRLAGLDRACLVTFTARATARRRREAAVAGAVMVPIPFHAGWSCHHRASLSGSCGPSRARSARMMPSVS